jgi:hypothetical protein
MLMLYYMTILLVNRTVCQFKNSTWQRDCLPIQKSPYGPCWTSSYWLNQKWQHLDEWPNVPPKWCVLSYLNGTAQKCKFWTYNCKKKICPFTYKKLPKHRSTKSVSNLIVWRKCSYNCKPGLKRVTKVNGWHGTLARVNMECTCSWKRGWLTLHISAPWIWS